VQSRSFSVFAFLQFAFESFIEDGGKKRAELGGGLSVHDRFLSPLILDVMPSALIIQISRLWSFANIKFLLLFCFAWKFPSDEGRLRRFFDYDSPIEFSFAFF
jgi:hypothetical protein